MAIEIQTAYTEDYANGYPGMVANGETSNRISRTVADAAGIGFGVPVYRGSADHECTATVGTLATFYGWTLADVGVIAAVGGDADEYAENATAGIITGGAVYITVTGAVADGDAITVGKGAGVADLYGATAADATHIATGWVADETVTDGVCRIVKR